MRIQSIGGRDWTVAARHTGEALTTVIARTLSSAVLEGPHMRYSFALAAIPVAVWAVWPAPSQPIAVRAVATEGVTARRLDEGSFRARWSPTIELMSGRLVHTVAPVTVRNGPASPTARWMDLPEAGSVSNATTGKSEAREARHVSRPLPPARTTRYASLGRDICARHKMRKVHYGKRWRCRR